MLVGRLEEEEFWAWMFEIC